MSETRYGLIRDVVEIAELLEKRKLRNKIKSYYPETGDLRRDLYPKHMDFMAAGASYRQRLMLAANRVGKTEGVGGYETTLHLTGNYPNWWTGRRFTTPIRAWAAGDTSKTVRDIIQYKLLGPPGNYGTGLIPGDLITKTTPKQGISDAVDSISVKHISGGNSTILLKSYDQRREAFQGTEQDLIWLDEEPPLAIYTECLLRTMTNSGLIMCTFTPLMGMSEVVLSFLPGGKLDAETSDQSKYVVMATWDDVPHLSEAVKKELYDSIPPFQRDARSKGVPQLGAGAIYPVPETDLLVTDFEIPDHWPRAYALDVGWNRTAAIWGAWDRDTDTVYLYSEHYRGQAEPIIHAEAIKGRGSWIPGVIDPAARGRAQRDGEQLLQQYTEMGLWVQPAKNSVEAGIYAVWQRMSAGKLKVFKSCSNWLTEFRLYRRDDKGHIVKENDHLQDCCVAPETIVNTTDGNFKIIDLVGKTGYVISKDGSRCRFIGARKTIINSPVVKLHFSDGTNVVCTPDHPFLTPDGWINACDMENKSCYNGVSQRIHIERLCKSLSIRKLVKNLKERAIIYAVTIFNVTVYAFTELFMNTLIIAKYKKEWTFITSTTIDQIMNLQTFNSNQDQHTLAIIKNATQEKYQNSLENKRQSGMDQKKVLNGINSIMKTISIFCTHAINLSVFNAIRNLKRGKQEQINFVQMPAKHERGFYQVLIMRNAFAWFVARSLWLIAMLKNKHAHENVLVKCNQVQNYGISDVYCLTVPYTSSFCIESGLVVHNTRYLIMSGLDIATTQPEEENEYQNVAGLSWMG
jgi:phage terminase large subunit-like protein